MRIRTIKPEFWDHPVMSRQSDATRLLAIGLLNLADDEGYFFADPKIVRNHLRPLDDNSVIVHGSITELSRIGYIKTIQHKTHGPIGKIVAFKSHQVINRPNSSKIKHLFDSVNDHGALNDPSLPEGKGKEGKGAGIKERNKSVGTADEFAQYAVSIGLPESDGRYLHDHFLETGWKRGKEPIKDWQAAMRKWKAQGWLPSQKDNGRKSKPNPTSGMQEQFEIPEL